MSRKRLDISDEQRADAQSRANAAYQRQYLSDLVAVASTPHGRRFLATLIFDECGLMSAGWRPGADIHLVAGKRSIGESLLGNLEQEAVEEAKSMTVEWFDRRNEWRLASERAGKTKEIE